MEINLSGDKKLLKTMSKLTGTEVKKGIRKAARSGAKKLKPVVKQQITETTEKESGELLKSVKVKALPRSRTKVGARITINANHAGHLEYGTEDIEKREFGQKAIAEAGDDALQLVGEEIRKELVAIWEGR